MKARHFIMLTILILIIIIMICVKDAKNTKKLTCTVNSNFHGMESLITLDIKVKNNEVKDINMLIDATLPEEYLNQKQNIINTLGADGNMTVTSTEDGIRLSTGMNSSYFKSLGLNTETSYSDLKETLELEGYSCK